jgi:hypothetical protein
MSKREQHKVAGKFFGVWYETAGGRKLYLGHRKRDQIYREKNAWCIDIYTLERCREMGVTMIGILIKDGGTRMVWMTLVSDFFGPHSFAHFTRTRQRGLPLPYFRIDPMKSEKFIAKSLRIK